MRMPPLVEFSSEVSVISFFQCCSKPVSHYLEETEKSLFIKLADQSGLLIKWTRLKNIHQTKTKWACIHLGTKISYHTSKAEVCIKES